MKLPMTSTILTSLLAMKSVFQVAATSRSVIRRHWRQNKLFSTDGSDIAESNHGSGDLLLSGLNEQQDISIKVVSCREIVQESLIKNHMSPVSAKALGEVLACTLMMGSGLKNQESLQINLVGNEGLRNVMAITDSDLKVRGMVGAPMFELRGNTSLGSAFELLGSEGQIQVVRNHPSYKRPTNGITTLRDTSIPMNLGFYLAESEQRTAAMITEVIIDGSLCRTALGVLVETLPGADPENIEKAIKNLEAIDKKGLSTYLQRTEEERTAENAMFRSFEPILEKILDDAFLDMGVSLQWGKTPSYACNCGVDKVWRVLRLLSKKEVSELIETQNTVDIKCEFCGTEYKIQKEEIEREILQQQS